MQVDEPAGQNPLREDGRGPEELRPHVCAIPPLYWNNSCMLAPERTISSICVPCQHHQTSAAVMKTGMLTRSSGSAYLEIGSTKVTVAVHGPRPPEGKAEYSVQGAVNVTVQYAPFSGVPVPQSKVRLSRCRALTCAQALSTSSSP